MTDAEIIDRHKAIAQGAGGDVRLSAATAKAMMRLHEKLAQIVVVCDDNANVPHPDLALKFVREVASS